MKKLQNYGRPAVLMKRNGIRDAILQNSFQRLELQPLDQFIQFRSEELPNEIQHMVQKFNPKLTTDKESQFQNNKQMMEEIKARVKNNAKIIYDKTREKEKRQKQEEKERKYMTLNDPRLPRMLQERKERKDMTLNDPRILKRRQEILEKRARDQQNMAAEDFLEHRHKKSKHEEQQHDEQQNHQKMEEESSGTGLRKQNPWINHVKEFAKKQGISYSKAMKDANCKSSYKK